jgi:hypothetical protein
VYRGKPSRMQPHDLLILMLLFSVLFWGDMVESTVLGLWQYVNLATSLGTYKVNNHSWWKLHSSWQFIPWKTKDLPNRKNPLTTFLSLHVFTTT